MAHKLLLADDSVTIQRVIELTFADEDVQVIAVGDGKKAIASIQADRPDIVLADVGMPERDGYEVAAFIKGKTELAHIPVLLLTGAFEPIDEARARAVGCDGVLVKPFEPQMVINRVKDLLAGRRAAPTPASSAATQAPLGQPTQPGDFNLRAAPQPSAAPGAPGTSLEDYFDRLDAAFAGLDSPSGEPASPPALVPVPTPVQTSAPVQPHAAAPVPTPVPEPRPPQLAQPSAEISTTGAAAYAPLDDLAGWDPDLGDAPSLPASGAPQIAPSYAAPASSAYGASTSHTAARDMSPAAPPAHGAAPQKTAPSAYEDFAPHMPVAHIEPAPAPQARATYASPAPISAPQPAAPPQPAAQMPTLADAFAALLSAEQTRPIRPAAAPPAPAPAAPPVSEEMVEGIVRRVLAAMSERTVKDTVLEVAERLVREEIQRLKTQ